LKDPLVTVVTPSYNQGHFIRATIESVLSQDYPNVEYIVMDGGSTDTTAAVVREYSSRLTFISEKDRGQSHAINKGFRMSKGSLVSWLNSDDIILPGAISHAVNAFAERPKLGAVYGEGYLIDYDGNVTGRFPATEPFNLWKLVYASDFILQQTVYFTREVFDEIGFLDENLHWGMDWDILIRIGLRYPIQYLPQYLGCLREYGEAKTFSGGAKRFRELAAIMRTHGGVRYPPGYITYGLETYQKIICDAIGAVTPEFFRRPSDFLRKSIAHAAHLYIARTLRECQGLYSDGWAAEHLRYMLCAGEGAVRFSGILHQLGDSLKGQVLTIHCNGVEVKRREIGFGEFEILFDAPNAPLHIDVKASRYIVPSKAGVGPDPRRLCYEFKGMERAG
jgi:glycosyltransferase involved in cell wall biosynthesis